MIGLHSAMLALVLAGAGADEPILLEFSAPWCAPCRQMTPVVDQMIAQGYAIKKIDFDSSRELAGKFKVEGIPCFVMTVGGRETARLSGAVPPQKLEAMFAEAQKLAAPRMLPRPSQEPVPLTPNPNSQTPLVPLPLKLSDSALALEARPAGVIGQTISLSNGTASPAQPAIAYGPGQMPEVAEADLIAVTVRLRVHDAQGSGCGTGTIIDSRDGQALILTCGHIFREYRDGDRIEVDLFGLAEPQTVPGRLLSFDDNRDVGLLCIQTPGPVKAARLAPVGYTVDVGETVASVGCNHGENPTVRRNKVTARDKFLGPPNIEVAGLPVQGRSGGGLFSGDGFVIGVCNAADPEANEGLYAALPSLHQQLDDANLSFVYNREEPRPVDEAPMVAVDQPVMSKDMPDPDPLVQLTESRENVPGGPLREATTLPADEQRLLEELRRRRAEGAEVICIIRTKDSPEARSEVFLFENASPRLIESLHSEGFSPR